MDAGNDLEPNHPNDNGDHEVQGDLVDMADEDEILAAVVEILEGGSDEEEEDMGEEEIDEDDSDSDDESTESGNEEEVLTLTGQERAWALEIKTAVEAPNSGIRPVCDFEYAQYALVTKGDLQEALRCLKGMQLFRSHYQVDDTVSQAVSALEQFIALMPGTFLMVDKCPDTLEGIVVVDISKYLPEVAQTPSPGHSDLEHNWKIHILFWYYVIRTAQPGFKSIRKGIVALVETADAGWDNMDMSFEQRTFAELWAHYPWIAKSTRVYNSGLVSTIWVSLLKRFISNQHFQAIRMGCEVGEDDVNRDPTRPKLKLSELYLQPGANRAGRCLLLRATELLDARRVHEESFRL
ncbi:expressed unknown protein [Seminavis robusta]|uniref:Uncharacterized protein n=1 Tax=Seminavis robusta TaxID=568900 RepID=A0A9N8D578_9STRA|nr:expressed unknown protein [Seminavis robusta]|eukprot:Sro3_g002750.1 n/a (351) ;mRNA; r:233201-234253